MKNFKALIVLLAGMNCWAQDPDPDLFQTWYLYSYTDLEGENQYTNDVPIGVVPEFVIEDIFEGPYFTGVICEEYGGNFTYNSSEDSLFLEFFDLCLCGNCIDPDPLVSAFEFAYYDVYYTYTNSNFDYEIVTEQQTGYQHLLLYPSPEITISYYNVVPFLTVSENKLNAIEIYPNPVSDQLLISYENISVEKLSVYSISGLKVLEIENIENSIDVSSLSEGLYFLEIYTSEGVSLQKFIKN